MSLQSLKVYCIQRKPLLTFQKAVCSSCPQLRVPSGFSLPVPSMNIHMCLMRILRLQSGCASVFVNKQKGVPLCQQFMEPSLTAVNQRPTSAAWGGVNRRCCSQRLGCTLRSQYKRNDRLSYAILWINNT